MTKMGSRTDREEDREAIKDRTSREDRAKRSLENLNCAYCPPHGGENKKRWPKHGTKKKRKKGRGK